MGPQSGESFEYSPVERALLNDGWFRTGITGIAYRFGHLSISRGIAVFGLAMGFYLV